MPLSVFSGEILGGRLHTVPETVYVNQPFAIHFELETTFGSEISDLRISDFPNNPDLITVGTLESVARDRVMRGTQHLEIHRFTAQARCHKPVEHTFTPTLHCTLSEQRRASGFFAQWNSRPHQKRLDPFTLRALPLPDEGRPPHFSGAIGAFRLTGRLSQTAVQPGDIVTLSLDLTGQGWLGDAPLPSVPPSPLFKTYPPKETLRATLRAAAEQILIPQSTNATAIAPLTFAYFNPATGRYEETAAGPFTLTFTDAPARPRADVRVIDTARPSPPPLTPNSSLFPSHYSLLTAHYSLFPLFAAGAGTLAALFLFFLLRAARPRLALLLGLAALAAGLLAARALRNLRPPPSPHTLAQRADVRFAPSPSAPALFSLNPGTAVTPLEQSGQWLRIDASGRRGWITADTLNP